MKTAVVVLSVIVVAQWGLVGYLLWGRTDPCVTQRALEREYTFVLKPGDPSYQPPPEPPRRPQKEVFLPPGASPEEREEALAAGTYSDDPWVTLGLSDYSQEVVDQRNERNERLYQDALQQHAEAVEAAANQRGFLPERMSERVRRRYEGASFSCARSF